MFCALHNSLVFCQHASFVAESSRLSDVHHGSSTFHCDSAVNVEQVQSLMSRVSATDLHWQNFYTKTRGYRPGLL